MKTKKTGKIYGIFFIFLIISVILSVNISAVTENNQEKITLDFFWMQGCPACNQMKLFLEEIEPKHDFNINSYETSRNSALFLEKLEQYNVPSDRRGYVPTVFIKDKYFIGYNEQIKQAIESIIQGEDIDNGDNLIGETVKTKILGLWNVEFSLDKKSVFASGFILALLDSVNICSITVLIFLIIFSLSIGSVKRAFKIGLVFTSVIFIFYVVFMLLLTGILSYFIAQFGFYIRLAVILVSVLAGLILIKDFFWYGRGISLKIPESSKSILERYIKKATIGSTVILGILASLVELPCTAIFPLIYTTILAEAGIVGFQRVVYILFYNLIYIWPLLFLVFGTYFSWIKIENVDEKIQKFKGRMRLVAGIALLLISLYFAWPFLIR